MSKKTKIILISLFSFFIVAILGGYFYVSSQITPEKIKAQVVKSLEQTFPNAKVEVGDLKYSIGLSIKFNVSKTRVSYSKDSLFELKNIDVNVPIFAILKGGGSVNLEINQPYINYKKIKATDNWSLAMKQTKKSAPKKIDSKKSNEASKDSGSSSAALAAPAFILNSKVNVKLKDLKIDYLLDSKSKGSIVFNKILFKDVGLSDSSAFEIDSNFDLNLSQKDKLKLALLVIGEFKLEDLLEKSTIPLNMLVKLSDFNFSDGSLNVPNIDTNLDMNISKSGDMKGVAKIDLKNSNSIKFNFVKKNQNISIEDLDGKIALKDIFSIVKLNIPGVDSSSSQFILNGSLLKGATRINPNLKIKVNPGIVLNYEDVSVVSTFEGDMKNTLVSFLMDSKLLEGSMVANGKFNYDLNSKVQGPSNIKNLVSNVNLNGLRLKKELIQKVMYSKNNQNQSSSSTKSSTTQADASAKPTKTNSAPPLILPGTFSLNLNDNSLGTSKLTGGLKMKVTKSKIDFSPSKINFDKGVLSFRSQVFNFLKSPKGNVNVGLKNINMNSFNAFLPPSVGGVEGTFNGSIKGSFAKAGESFNHDISVNLNGKDGKVEKIDISEYVSELINNVPMIKKKIGDKPLKIDPNFEKFTIKSRFKQDIYNFNSIYFLGMKDKVELKGNGKLFPLGKSKSEMFFDYKDPKGKISKVLKKEAGTETLPMKLAGVGMGLKPDYGYTIKKLSKGLVKNRGKKEAKKAIEKGLNKFLKGKDGKKIKSLLKGFSL